MEAQTVRGLAEKYGKGEWDFPFDISNWSQRDFARAAWIMAKAAGRPESELREMERVAEGS